MMNFDFTVSKVVLCCYVLAGTGKRRHENRKNSGFAYYETGEGRYVFDDGTALSVRAGEIIFLPQGSSYRVENANGDCWAINFESPDLVNAAPEVFAVRDRAGQFRAFQKAEECFRAKKPGYRFRCHALLCEILYQAVHEAGEGYADRAKFERIAPAVSAIHEGYTDALSIEALAGACGITPEYFRALFKKEFGISPLKYVNRLRLSRAEELLGTGLYSVTEAARLSGFSDLSRFSREFKQYSGLSPTAFAKRGQ